ncbi:MAG: hypothetical protein Udaeo2_19780 [Candidatus Udaeobacter sp.]|nr:MAG: hypothetical protein Udaeo2_19780 [Candidatus Udaeobacter sp.]
MHFGKRRREKYIVVRKEGAVPIVPAAKFSKTGLNITELRFRQLDLYVVIVRIPDRVAVDRKQAVFAKRPLKVQVLDAAVSGIGREPVLLFELSVVPVHNGAANAELDPVLVFRSFFCCCHCFSIDGFAGAQPSGGKDSRANQHKKFARYTYHKI